MGSPPLARRDRKGGVPVKRRAASAWWEEQMSAVFTPEADFRKELRLPRIVFEAVLEAIKEHPVFSVPLNVGARKVGVDKQLACFLLRIGKNETVGIVRRRLAVSESTVSKAVRRVALAIKQCLGHHVQMPLNRSQRKADVKAMFAKAEQALADSVGIIDCTHIRITVPVKERRAGNEKVYLDRKGNATLTFQAITTPEKSPRFLSLSGGIPGSAYDTRLLTQSNVYMDLDCYLEGDEFLMGDCGYTLRPWMMRGWANSELNPADPSTFERRSFNRHYSSVRISVERAFGILKARFRALGEKIRFRKEEDYINCMWACCILHNMCAEANAVRFYPRAKALARNELTLGHAHPPARPRNSPQKRSPHLLKRSTRQNLKNARGKANNARGQLRWDMVASQLGGKRGSVCFCTYSEGFKCGRSPSHQRRRKKMYLSLAPPPFRRRRALLLHLHRSSHSLKGFREAVLGRRQRSRLRLQSICLLLHDLCVFLRLFLHLPAQFVCHLELLPSHFQLLQLNGRPL